MIKIWFGCLDFSIELFHDDYEAKEDLNDLKKKLSCLIIMTKSKKDVMI